MLCILLIRDRGLAGFSNLPQVTQPPEQPWNAVKVTLAPLA